MPRKKHKSGLTCSVYTSGNNSKDYKGLSMVAEETEDQSEALVELKKYLFLCTKDSGLHVYIVLFYFIWNGCGF